MFAELDLLRSSHQRFTRSTFRSSRVGILLISSSHMTPTLLVLHTYATFTQTRINLWRRISEWHKYANGRRPSDRGAIMQRFKQDEQLREDWKHLCMGNLEGLDGLIVLWLSLLWRVIHLTGALMIKPIVKVICIWARGGRRHRVPSTGLLHPPYLFLQSTYRSSKYLSLHRTKISTMPSTRLRDLIRSVRQTKTAQQERDVIAKEAAALREAFKLQESTYRHRHVWLRSFQRVNLKRMSVYNVWTALFCFDDTRVLRQLNSEM